MKEKYTRIYRAKVETKLGPVTDGIWRFEQEEAKGRCRYFEKTYPGIVTTIVPSWLVRNENNQFVRFED